MKRPSVTALTHWCITHPWRTVAWWLLVVLAAIVTSALVPTQTAAEADTLTGESGRAAALVRAAGLEEPQVESVLLTARAGTLDVARAQQASGELRKRLTGVAGVQEVADPVWSLGHDALLLPVTMAGDATEVADHVDGVAAARAQVQDTYPDLSVEQVGAASLNAAVNERVGQDLGSGEALGLPLTFVILLVAFGAVVAAGIPVLLAFSSVLLTLGLYAPLSYLVPDAGSVSNVVLLIGMAVGVDYSLFFLKRQRDERRGGRSNAEAIEVAAATSGHTVVTSGAAVVVAMSGLLITGNTVFTGLGIGTILVVVVAVLTSLTVLPALLVKLGGVVDRPRVPLLWRLVERTGPGAVSGRLLRPVLRRPRAAAAVSCMVLLACAAPALGMRLHESSLQSLPQDLPAVQAAQHLQQRFPAERPDIVVAVHGDDSTLLRGALDETASAAMRDGLGTPAKGMRASADGRTAVLTLSAPDAEGADVNGAAVRTLREQLLPQVMEGASGVDWAVGGDVAEGIDSRNGQSRSLPWVVAFVLLLTMAMIGATFRSLTVAVVTTVLNLLSVGAAFGVLTLVFTHSWADGLLAYTSTGALVDWVPLFCFVVLVGLSMDYHVFVLSRFREALQSGMPYRAAVEHSVRTTASVVTSAALVMVSVFAVFATLSMVEMKQMGVGLSVAVLVDATIVRLVLLPALLLLLRSRLEGLGWTRGTSVRPQPADGSAIVAELVR